MRKLLVELPDGSLRALTLRKSDVAVYDAIAGAVTVEDKNGDLFAAYHNIASFRIEKVS